MLSEYAQEFTGSFLFMSAVLASRNYSSEIAPFVIVIGLLFTILISTFSLKHFNPMISWVSLIESWATKSNKFPPCLFFGYLVSQLIGGTAAFFFLRSIGYIKLAN